MNGTQPIVVNIKNSYQFCEHDCIEAAKAEAHRLAKQDRNSEGVFVVYVPIAVIRKTPPTSEVGTAFTGAAEGDLPF